MGSQSFIATVLFHYKNFKIEGECQITLLIPSCLGFWFGNNMYDEDNVIQIYFGVNCFLWVSFNSLVIYLLKWAIVHIHFLLTANRNKEYISIYIYVILNVNMIDPLWLVGQTLVLPWKSLTVKFIARVLIKM